jgi:hypothetical protein
VAMLKSSVVSLAYAYHIQDPEVKTKWYTYKVHGTLNTMYQYQLVAFSLPCNIVFLKMWNNFQKCFIGGLFQSHKNIFAYCRSLHMCSVHAHTHPHPE